MLLVVDDQVGNVQMMFEIFKTGYEVCMATSGADALLFCQSRLPDVMLLDVVMPGMNGFDLCRRLKADPRTADVPIIFVTAQDDPLEEARGLDAGGIDFITKPFHIAVVQARVRTHLVLKQQADQLRLQQRQLEQSHAELRAINDSSPLGLFHMTPAAFCTYVNRTYETITQRDSAAAYGAGWKAAVHPDDLKTLDDGWRHAAGEATRFASVLRLCRPDGTTCQVQMRAAPVVIRGVMTGYVGTIEDITEHRETQQRLADSNRRLRTITENIPALVAHVDVDERYLYVNAQIGRTFDKDPAAMVGHTISEEYSPALYAFVRPHIVKVLSGRTANFEGQTVVPGGLRHFQSTYIPDKNADGVVRGFFSMTFDITRRKQAEIVQAENEKRLRTITDNLPALITYIDRNHCFQFVNATMQAWTGIPVADICGKPFIDVMGATLYAERREHIERALAGERLEFEMTAEAFGHVRHIHSTYIPDVDGDGTVRGIYTLSSDISRLKATEQELRKHARFDPLTGLPNRPHLYEILDAALARGRRHQTAIAVFFLDIDRFKTINDLHGHADGDLVLQAFAARLVGAVRVTDTVARLAGDEFVVVLEDLKQQDEAEKVAEKILEATRLPIPLDQDTLHMTTSLGIVFDATLERSARALIALADESLYQAKAAGRNTFRAQRV
ncbi:MAG: diguanylate cyclase [Herminiimonas sp.]|nr:diguanylate cyclase [Herminiimonas sp.]